MFDLAKKIFFYFHNICQPKLLRHINTKTIQSLSHHNFLEKFDATLEEINSPNSDLYTINNVTIGYHSGAIWKTDSANIFLQSSGSLQKLLSWGGFKKDVWLKSKKLKNNRNLVYFPIPLNGYYHFLVETLPRLYFICNFYANKKQGVVIAVQINATSFLKASLEELDKKFDIEIIYINSISNYIVDQACFVSYDYPYNPDKKMISFMRESLSSAFLHDNSSTSLQVGKGCVYISRRTNKRRSLKSEEYIESILQKMGFEVVIFESLTLREQVLLINKTQILVGIHGAGLSNMVFLNKGATVIEIRLSDYINTCFKDLSDTVASINYHCLNLSVNLNREASQDEIIKLCEKIKSIKVSV